MTSSIEVFWSRLKQTAQKYAGEDVRLNEKQARSVIAGLLRDVHVDPRPPEDVLEFYARELVAFIDAEMAASRVRSPA